MKTRKLSQHGFAHSLILPLVVVVVAVIGTYMLVASRADSCPPVSGATSGAMSGPVSAATSGSCPVSGATSSPVSAAPLRTNIYPVNWKLRHNAVVTYDGTRKVIQFNPAAGASSVSTSTAKHLVMPQLDSILQQSRGKTLRICVNGKSLTGTTSTLNLSLEMLMRATPVLPHLSVNLVDRYTTPCTTIAINPLYTSGSGTLTISATTPADMAGVRLTVL